MSVDGVLHFLRIFDKDHVRVVLQVIGFGLFDDKIRCAEHGVFLYKGQPVSQCQLIGGSFAKALGRIDGEGSVPVVFHIHRYRIGAVLRQYGDICLNIVYARKTGYGKGNIRFLVVQTKGGNIELLFGFHWLVNRSQGHVCGYNLGERIVGFPVFHRPVDEDIIVLCRSG